VSIWCKKVQIGEKMKRFLLLFLSAVSVNSVADIAFAYPRLNWRSADFEGRRVIAESAWKTENEAQRRGEVLYFENKFQNLGVLWIPFYQNLSGKKLYQTIIVPDGNCDSFLRRYTHKLKRSAYCFTPSNRGLAPNRRGV
jgi:hypothetical protein